MKTNRERRLWRLLGRRIGSSGGNAYFEFAIVAPLALYVLFFALDFVRILYCEQQLEIASRLLADVESHMVPGTAQGGRIVEYPKLPNAGAPHTYGKQAVRQYLFDVLQKEGLETRGRVYCRGWCYAPKGLAQGVFKPILDFLKGEGEKLPKSLKIIGKIFGSMARIVTMGNDKYFTEILPTDRCVMTSVSVFIKPFAPFGPYTHFGRILKTGDMLIVQATPKLGGGTAAYNRPIIDGERERYYCHLPVLDTHPLALATYVRKLKQVFGRFL